MSNSNLTYKLVANQDGWKKHVSDGKPVLIPCNWNLDSLGGLAEIQKGQTLTRKEAKAGSIPVVAGGKSPSGYHNEANRPAGTITVSASGANAGHISFYKEPIFATDCSTVISKKSDQLYLYFALRSKQAEVTQMQVGGAQPHVYPSDLQKLCLCHPQDTEEQQRIASVLSTQESRIEDLRAWAKVERQRLSWLTEELLSGRVRVVERQGGTETVVEADENGVAKEVLGAFELVANWEGWKNIEINGSNTKIPATWRTAKIGEEIRFTLGHTPAKESNNYQGETPWITISNLQGRTITKYSGKISSTKTRILPKGSLVGSFKMTVGRFAILGINAVTNEAIVGATPDDAPNHDLNYLRLALVSPFKNGASTNGQGVQLLNTKTINSLYFIAPKKEEQKLISRIISSQENHVEDIETLISLEQKRLAWLTEELLSGRVRVEACTN